MYTPANNLFERVAVKDVMIEDIKIRKGEFVNISLYSLHMNPVIF